MSKPLPYYPMYVFDFDEDKNVLAMNVAEIGVYVLALNESWKRGSIPDDPTALAGMIRKKPAEVRKAWAAVRACWISNGKPGELINPRLEKERQFSIQRSAVASASSKKRWDEHNAEASPARSESVSVSGLEPEECEKASTGARGETVDFGTFLHRWKQHRGFKKPQKYLIERAALRWQKVEVSEEELSTALDGYFAADWARKENYPILGFVKDPHSWIVRAAPEVELLPAPVDLPPVRLEPVSPVLIDYPARWNELVPAKPVTWDARRGAGAALRECEADPVFRERFDEMCHIAQKIYATRGSEADWLTFEFAIRRNGKGVGWWRVLNEFASMGKAKAPVRRKSVVELMREGAKANVHPGV